MWWTPSSSWNPPSPSRASGRRGNAVQAGWLAGCLPAWLDKFVATWLGLRADGGHGPPSASPQPTSTSPATGWLPPPPTAHCLEPLTSQAPRRWPCSSPSCAPRASPPTSPSWCMCIWTRPCGTPPATPGPGKRRTGCARLPGLLLAERPGPAAGHGAAGSVLLPSWATFPVSAIAQPAPSLSCPPLPTSAGLHAHGGRPAGPAATGPGAVR